MGESEKDLYLPINTPDADDFIQGVGAVELCVYSVGLAVCFLIGLWINLVIGNTMVATAGAIFLFAIVVLLFRRNFYNETVIKITLVIWRFARDQKIYEYAYHNIYEVVEEVNCVDEETENRNSK